MRAGFTRTSRVAAVGRLIETALADQVGALPAEHPDADASADLDDQAVVAERTARQARRETANSADSFALYQRLRFAKKWTPVSSFPAASSGRRQ